MSVKISHGGCVIFAECADELNDVAQSLFNLVTSQMDRGAKLRDGVKVDFGWTEFQVASINGVLVFCEPDFDSDPESNYRKNLDCSLSGYRRQKLLVDVLGIGRWDPAQFSETVIAEKGVLAASRIVANRIADADKRSSWLVCLETTARGKQEITLERLKSDFEQIPVWHIYHVRPPLFDALALPVGFQVLIDDSRVVQVESNEGEHWSI